MNDFQTIMLAAWNIMNIPITIYGFTITYGQVYLFSLISGLVAIAIFKILWG